MEIAKFSEFSVTYLSTILKINVFVNVYEVVLL